MASVSDMHPADIQAALKKRGIKQVDIARSEQVSETQINRVIYGRDRSRRVENAISKAARIPASTLWPHWYSGTRRTKVSRRHRG